MVFFILFCFGHLSAFNTSRHGVPPIQDSSNTKSFLFFVQMASGEASSPWIVLFSFFSLPKWLLEAWEQGREGRSRERKRGVYIDAHRHPLRDRRLTSRLYVLLLYTPGA